MKITKGKIFFASIFIGIVATVAPAYSAGFSPSSIGEWFINALFVSAILGFIGVKFLLDEPYRSPNRKRKNKRISSMKKLLYTLLLLLIIAITASAQTVSYNGSRQDYLIDVRTPAEFNAAHLYHAVNIPLEQIDSGILSVPGLTKDSHILVYCRSGRRSEAARLLLQRQGFSHVLNGGGMLSLESRLKPCNTTSC